MALLDVRWLHQKAVWFPDQVYVQERLRRLANSLRALASRVGERGRVEALRRCHDETAQLRGLRCFGRFVSPGFHNQL